MLFSLQPCPSTFKNSSTTSYWPSGVVVSAAGVVTGPPSIKSRIYMNLHGVLLLNFWWDLLACMLGYIYLEPFACWKLYEEAVCYLVPEGDGTYLDLGRATVNRQMQPENSSCQRDLYEVLPRHSIVCTGLQCSSQLQVLWRDHLQ